MIIGFSSVSLNYPALETNGHSLNLEWWFIPQLLVVHKDFIWFLVERVSQTLICLKKYLKPDLRNNTALEFLKT